MRFSAAFSLPLLLLASVTSSFTPAFSQQLLAPTPPMGWNSWDAYGSAVTEAEVRANAAAMARELKPFGWNYIVVDIQWYEPGAHAGGYRPGAPLDMDSNGRLIPAVNRFPSSANGAGFGPLADYVHSLGLQFGIHILRGIPRQAANSSGTVAGTSIRLADIADRSSTCQWNTDMFGVDMTKPGAQAYYDSLAALYASWHVDFVKADDMSRPYHAAEISALHHAILHSGRPMVLSLSPGPAPPAQIQSLRDNAQMWRVSDDVWDRWDAIRKSFDYAETWASLIAPGHWPDQDMLPLGHLGIRAHVGTDRMTRLTHDEQQSLITLWAMVRSPLIFGGDIVTLDPFTRSLLTNRVVLEIDQHSSHNRLIASNGPLRVWAADTPDGHHYVALFNLGDHESTFTLPAAQLGAPVVPLNTQEVWTRHTLKEPRSAPLETNIPSHGVRLYRLN